MEDIIRRKKGYILTKKKRLHINNTKTYYLWCNFWGEPNGEGIEVCVDDHVLQLNESFKYTRSIIHKEVDVDDDVTNHIKAGWLK